MSRPPRPRRRILPRLAASLLAVALAVAPVLAACSAGQITQTDTQVPGVDGTLGQAGDVLARNAVFAAPSDQTGGGRTGDYQVGEDVPLQLTLVNGGDTADRLVGASSPVASSVAISGDTTIPGHSSLRVLPPPAAATATPPPTDTTGALPGVAAAPASGSPTSGPAAPVAPGILAVGTLHVVLIGLTQPVKPGLTYPVTLVFARGGALTLQVPIENSTAPRVTINP